MPEVVVVTTERPLSPEKQIEQRLAQAYAAATPEDREAVHELIRKAVGATQQVDTVKITPGMAAILWKDHNSQNRKWHHALSLEYEAMMLSGDWEFGPTIKFGDNGGMIDGQHRLAALALSGVTLSFAIVLGCDLRSVEVIDTGRRRVPAAAVHILQHKEMSEATIKTDIIRKADIFIAKATNKPSPIAGNTRLIGRELKTHEAMIEVAIELGKLAGQGIAKPTFKLRDAQVLAYVLFLSNWAPPVVAQHLRRFQLGQDVGENTPFFVAAKILERESRGERYPLTSKLALAVKAFLLAQQGIMAVKPTTMRESMKQKNFPDPAYIAPATSQVA